MHYIVLFVQQVSITYKRIKKIATICLVFMAYLSTTQAQITTSSMNGYVSDGKNSLPGATVIATHLLSGSRYSTITNQQGYYQLQGMRTGGPYQIDISYVGFRPSTGKGIYLQLAIPYTYNTVLIPSTDLEEVVVKSTISKYSNGKTGASTHVGSAQIKLLPNVTRSLTDILKLTPYSNGNGFGGRDQRMNNFSVDGANFNYNMGLDGKVLPGGGSPISIDAVEETMINIATYDIRQTNFIGAAINIVTKSGTNDLKGSLYTYIKNEHLRGNNVDGYHLGEREKEARDIYGFTLGGPVIKNKIFFFINGEYEYSPFPIHKWKLSTDGQEDPVNHISRVTSKDMERFSNDLREMYEYNTGSWTNFNGQTTTCRLLMRADWNINDHQKFMIRYNYTTQKKDINLVGAALGIKGTPVSRYSMSFRNSMWQDMNDVHSLTAELFSYLSKNITNQILVSFTFNNGNNRKCKGDFPTIDIMKPDDSGTNRAFMNAGYEQHAWNNGITERVWAITDNLSFQMGRHNFTTGMSFESQNLSNCYLRYGAGYYRYASYEDFINKAAPVAFALGYSLSKDKRAPAKVNYRQFSIYAQDDYQITQNLKFTYGIRVDIPIYANKRYENPSIAEYTFYDTKLSTAYWPESFPLFSPRIGFTYDLSGNNIIILRGGSGIFSGRFPMIFLSKMQEGSGMLKNTVSTQKNGDPLLAALAGGIRTREKILQDIAPLFPDRFPTEPGAVNNITTIDRHFKMPQVWKSSLAVDYQLPLPFPSLLTLEGTFIKDIHAIMQEDVNTIHADDPRMTRFIGPDNRYHYPGDTEKRYHEDITNAILMRNSGKGYSANFNITLNAHPWKDVEFMAAYTYSKSKTITSNKSNQVDNAWTQEPSVMGPNYQKLHTAQYLQTPHRVIAQFSYTRQYARLFSTSLSLFYTGEYAGNYSYLYDGDMNNDGIEYDLIYIPRTKEELHFADRQTGEITFTAEEQKEAFWTFINQDPYLKKHKGEYAEAYAANLPWYDRFNLRVVQDFKIQTGQHVNTIQFSVDIMNLGNLLHNSWGVTQTISACNNGKLLELKEVNETGEPVYTMCPIKKDGQDILPNKTFETNRSSENCWQLQIGIRYIFN